MSNKNISLMLKFVIIFIALVGLLICTLWYPFSLSLTAIKFISPVSQLQKVEFWVQLMFYWLVSIPCFVMLIFYWKIANLIRKDKAFSINVVKKLNTTIKILGIDLVIFFIGNIVFTFLEWNDFALFYFILALLGLCIVCVTCILSHFVKEAALLKEESEGTI